MGITKADYAAFMRGGRGPMPQGAKHVNTQLPTRLDKSADVPIFVESARWMKIWQAGLGPFR